MRQMFNAASFSQFSQGHERVPAPLGVDVEEMLRTSHDRSLMNFAAVRQAERTSVDFERMFPAGVHDPVLPDEALHGVCLLQQPVKEPGRRRNG
jgi:hypothetical protein